MNITITSRCPFCGRYTHIMVDHEQYERCIFDKALIQDVFPNLSATDRETLISGMCPECQEEIFGSDDEDF